MEEFLGMHGWRNSFPKRRGHPSRYYRLAFAVGAGPEADGRVEMRIVPRNADMDQGRAAGGLPAKPSYDPILIVWCSNPRLFAARSKALRAAFTADRELYGRTRWELELPRADAYLAVLDEANRADRVGVVQLDTVGAGAPERIDLVTIPNVGDEVVLRDGVTGAEPTYRAVAVSSDGPLVELERLGGGNFPETVQLRGTYDSNKIPYLDSGFDESTGKRARFMYKGMRPVE